ncbi:MAG: zinc ribbon domain-containing protein [Caldilineaceae bacterium]|nr:zinc ribbon domain-containing protein [Caldilineaceae bacterium]
MAKKSLGYVKLEWICPNCKSRNPGPQQKCGSCGAAQPADVEFVQPLQEEIIEEKAQIERAAAGPDIHCGYCGARNAATDKVCVQCGADLKAGQARAAGQVLGAHRSQSVPDVTCPACGSANPASAQRCQRCGAGLLSGAELMARAPKPNKQGGFGRAALFVGLGIVALIVVFLALMFRTEETIGVVQDVNWERRIEIQALVPVAKENWIDQIPSGVAVGQCRKRVARTQDEPTANAREVCGTPYTVDQGSGFGEVVQECRYEILEDWCEYKVDEWRSVDSVSANGPGVAALWPELRLDTNQREGRRSEEYTILFSTDGDNYRYKVSQANDAAKFEKGSRWILSVNTFNAVTNVEPAR